MISVARYRSLTGDTASTNDDVETAITDAQALLEEYLGRPLEAIERTETMRPDRGGMIWPKATPLVEADGWTIDGLGLVGTRSAWYWGQDAFEVTYTGGWSAPDDVSPISEVLPTCLQRDIAMAAYRLLHPTISQLVNITPGADSVRLGDAAVSGKGLGGGENTDSWWSRRTRGYRYAPVGMRPPPRESFV